MRKRNYRKRGFKLKLRKETIYTIFSFGLISSGVLLLISFTKSGESFIVLNGVLDKYFGWASIFFPVILILFGFLVSKLHFFLSRPNVAIGFLLIFVSIASLTQSGILGSKLFLALEEILTGLGAGVVFIAGLFIGIIVFFDTSIDEVFSFFTFIYNNISRLFPSGLLSIFKTKKQLIIKGKQPMTIKGGERPALNAAQLQLKINKKEPVILSEKLVSNTLVSGVIWEYPPLNLLADAPDKKADRGDVNKVAAVIEKTLQS